MHILIRDAACGKTFEEKKRMARKSCLKPERVYDYSDIIFDPNDECTSTSSSSRRRERKVWFDRIQVLEHAYELGDNPSVSDGAPLTISWKCQSKKTYEIEYYEEIYRPTSERRGVKSGLRLSVSQRSEVYVNVYGMKGLSRECDHDTFEILQKLYIRFPRFSYTVC